MMTGIQLESIGARRGHDGQAFGVGSAQGRERRLRGASARDGGGIPAGTLVKPHSHDRRTSSHWCWPVPSGSRIGDQVLSAEQGQLAGQPRGTPPPCYAASGCRPRHRDCPAPGGLEG